MKLDTLRNLMRKYYERGLTMESVSKWLLSDAEKDEFIATLTPNLPALRTQAEISQEGIVTFKAYTVVAGDSLSKICAENNLDYGANYKIILAINGIKDANQIYVGQTILLPFAD